MSKLEAAPPLVVTEITTRTRLFPDFGEAWRHRALAVILARRNIKVRFRQTLLGRAWMVIQPILLTGVFALLLGGLLRVPSDGLPYAVFAYSGMALWVTFQRGVTELGISLVASGSLLSKVYFPRLLIPISTILTILFDFLFVYAVAVVVVIAYGLFPGWPILLSPLPAALALLMALAIGLWTTVIDLLFRDARLLIPYALQLVFYASPVIYSATLVPERWRAFYAVNPMVGVLQAFRWTMVAGVDAPTAAMVLYPLTVMLFLLVTGLMIFARFERLAVDRL